MGKERDLKNSVLVAAKTAVEVGTKEIDEAWGAILPVVDELREYAVSRRGFMFFDRVRDLKKMIDNIKTKQDDLVQAKIILEEVEQELDGFVTHKLNSSDIHSFYI